MNIKFKPISTLLILSLFSCISRRVERVNDKNLCYYFLKDIQKYWCIDTIGNNGYRILASEKLEKLNCNFIGMSQNTIIKIFGKPNQQFNLNSNEILRYKLTNYGSYDAPGQRYLEFYLDSTLTVIKTKYWKVDG